MITVLSEAFASGVELAVSWLTQPISSGGVTRRSLHAWTLSHHGRIPDVVSCCGSWLAAPPGAIYKQKVLLRKVLTFFFLDIFAFFAFVQYVL